MCAPRLASTGTLVERAEPNHEPLLLPGAGQRERRWFVYVAFIFPACAGLLFGYDIGAASGAIGGLQKLANLSGVMNSVLTAASLMGATLGSVMVFYVGEPLGRRRELMIGALLYAIGSGISIMFPDSAAVGAALVGRIIYGLGVAFSSELTPPSPSHMSSWPSHMAT